MVVSTDADTRVSSGRGGGIAEEEILGGEDFQGFPGVTHPMLTEQQATTARNSGRRSREKTNRMGTAFKKRNSLLLHRPITTKNGAISPDNRNFPPFGKIG